MSTTKIDGPKDLTHEEYLDAEKRLGEGHYYSSVPALNWHEGNRDYVGPPRCCPFCGGIGAAMVLNEWRAESLDDTGSEAVLMEFQCQGPCEGRSFWA